jgi:hypothetical protein
VHLHGLVLDGVFTQAAPAARPVFHQTRAPTTVEVLKLASSLQRKVLRLLRARGFSFDDADADAGTSADETALAAAQAASVQGRIAFGERRGFPVPRLGRDAGRARVRVAGERCADVQGFSLDTDVRIAARERPRLESLCRYVLRRRSRPNACSTPGMVGLPTSSRIPGGKNCPAAPLAPIEREEQRSLSSP